MSRVLLRLMWRQASINFASRRWRRRDFSPISPEIGCLRPQRTYASQIEPSALRLAPHPTALAVFLLLRLSRERFEMFAIKATGQAMVSDVRDIKDKAGKVFKRIVKLATMGCMVEATWPDSLGACPAAGTAVVIEGTLGNGYNNSIEVTLSKVTVQK